MPRPNTLDNQAAKALDVEALRRDFPILSRRVHDKPLVYLDNGATTQKPEVVIERISRYYREENSNIHRGVHWLSQEATREYELARQRVASFLGANRQEEIVFTRGTTEAVNLVAHSFVRPRLEPGDEILVTGMEHHANIVPWQMLSEKTGAVLRHVPLNERGEAEIDAYRALLTDRTRFVGLVHVSNALGTVNPVREMTRIAHEKGIPVLVDGAQAVAHTPVDVQDLGCDFYCFSGHKIFGPTGIGALWSRYEHLEVMEPWQGGGDMILSVSFEGTTYNRIPARFEAGTPHIAGGIALATALDYVDAIGLERIEAYEKELLAYGTERLEEVEGLRLIGTARDKAGILSFVLDDIHAHDVGTILDHEGIAVRAGHHCAQPAIESFGVSATVRASLALYNTREELDTLVEGLAKVRSLFG